MSIQTKYVELKGLLADDKLAAVPLLVFANKEDLKSEVRRKAQTHAIITGATLKTEVQEGEKDQEAQEHLESDPQELNCSAHARAEGEGRATGICETTCW